MGKRILVNDPDMVERMHQLEVLVQKDIGEIAVLKQQKGQLESHLQDANTKITQLQTELGSKTEHKGVTYTRWGRIDCPGNGTELVYSGTVGGGYFSNPGSPVNYLCLPHDPNFIDGDITQNAWISTIYGTEYEDGQYFGNKNLHDNDVPCAVCRASHKSSMLMIPGKTHCYGGWHKEYYGRLAANADVNIAASEYICVDVNAEPLEAGGADHNGKLVYAVKASCGSLRCPPFHDNAPLSCVVCSS